MSGGGGRGVGGGPRESAPEPAPRDPAVPGSDGCPSAGGPPAARTRRLFFALWPSAEQRDSIVAAARPVVDASGGRPVAPRNYHLTLAFLGAVPQSRLEDVKTVGESAARTHRRPGPPFLGVSLDRLEWWRGPRVLVAVAGTSAPEATALSGDLQSRLLAAGFRPDLKPFRPHVTLARKVSRATAGEQTLSVRLRFGSFALVDSLTEPEGSVYSVLASWTLCDS